MEKKSKSQKEDELISQTQAAEIRGVSRAAIADLIKRGRLRTIEIAGRPLLYRSEVESFEKIVEGRPSKIAADTIRQLNVSVKKTTASEQRASKKKGSKQ